MKSNIELHADYHLKEGILTTKEAVDFHYIYAGSIYRVCIRQNVIRRISVACDSVCNPKQLIDIMQVIEQIIMLFDGRFLVLDKLNIVDSNEDEKKYKEFCDTFIKRYRLGCYNSADYCMYQWMTLIDYSDIDISFILPLWCKIIDELKITHPMFLYCLADTGLPIDCKCASMIQVFQPLYELLVLQNKVTKSERKHQNKDGQTYLKECLKLIIKQYGQGVFTSELSNNFEELLTKLVNTRNYIMHVSSNIKEPNLDGVACVFYLVKLSMIYRRIFFELLGIPEETYQDRLDEAISRWDKWYNDL